MASLRRGRVGSSGPRRRCCRRGSARIGQRFGRTSPPELPRHDHAMQKTDSATASSTSPAPIGSISHQAPSAHSSPCPLKSVIANSPGSPGAGGAVRQDADIPGSGSPARGPLGGSSGCTGTAGDLCERRVQDQLPGGRSARYAPPARFRQVRQQAGWLASSGENGPAITAARSGARRSLGRCPRGDRTALFSIQQNWRIPDLCRAGPPCDPRRPDRSTKPGLTWIWRPAAAPRAEPLTVSAATRVQWRPLVRTWSVAVGSPR